MCYCPPASLLTIHWHTVARRPTDNRFVYKIGKWLKGGQPNISTALRAIGRSSPPDPGSADVWLTTLMAVTWGLRLTWPWDLWRPACMKNVVFQAGERESRLGCCNLRNFNKSSLYKYYGKFAEISSFDCENCSWILISNNTGWRTVRGHIIIVIFLIQ